MKKLETINFISILTLAVSFFMMIKIDNDSRLPENIATDYHMNSLPFIYIIIVCLLVLVVVSFLRMRAMKKDK